MAIYPASQEIMTVAEVKAQIGIPVATTTFDIQIASWIPVVRSQMEMYCDRKFLKWNWQQWFEYDRAIILPQYPVNNILHLGTPVAAISITDTSNNLQFFVNQPDSSNYTAIPKFVVTDSSDFTTTEFLFSTYTTIGDLKTAVEAAFATVTMAVSTAPVPDFSTMNTLRLRRGSGYTIYASIQQNVLYRIDDNTQRTLIIPQNVIVQFNALDYWFETSLLIMWEAGYTPQENVPQALQFIVSSIIRDMMSLYDLDSSGVPKNIFKSETLGDYSYTLDPSSMISNLINEKYAAQLEIWRKKSI